MSECKLFKRNGGPYGTIFATFSCRHRQKCSVSFSSCEVSHNGETIHVLFILDTNWTQVLHLQLDWLA